MPASPPNRAMTPTTANTTTGISDPDSCGVARSKEGGVASCWLLDGGVAAATGAGVEVAPGVTTSVGDGGGSGVLVGSAGC